MSTTLFSHSKNEKKGFAMLFTIMLVGIILAIALGIAEITFKQSILSNLASDSQISFYQADTALECGMLYDYLPASGIDVSTINVIRCGEIDLTYTATNLTEKGTEFIYTPPDFGTNRAPNTPCFTLTFTKGGTNNMIESRGYNICNQKSPRQVERALRVVY